MKDNKLLEAVETHIIGRIRKTNNLPSLMYVEDQSELHAGVFQQKVQFQIRFTALMSLTNNFSNEELVEAKKYIVKMYEQEIYDSIRNQVRSPLQELRQDALYRGDAATADKIKEIYDAIF